MFLRHLEKSISVFPQSLSSQERNTYKEYNSQVRNVFDLQTAEIAISVFDIF